MQPRTLDQILGELAGTYDPQINQIRQRQALIPGQIADEEKGLQAKQDQAFGDILGGARRRGLGFSGIPVGEQAKYASTEYLPALARLRQSGREQAMSLEDAIFGIQERRNTLAQGIRQQEVDRAEQIRQFNEQLAEQRRAASQQAAAYGSLYNTPRQNPVGNSATPQQPTLSLEEIFGAQSAPSQSKLPINLPKVGWSLAGLAAAPLLPYTTAAGLYSANKDRLGNVIKNPTGYAKGAYNKIKGLF